MYTTFFDVGDKVYHVSYGNGEIVEIDDTVSPPRYEVAFDRYPNQKITVVGDNDLVALLEPRELTQRLFGGISKNLARALNEKLSSDKTDKEVKDSKEKKDTMAMNERKISLDDNGNVVGGAIFGDNAIPQEVAPVFGKIRKPFDGVKHHREIVLGLNELYAKKNADYGDSFHETFKEEGMAMARIRLSDKLSRFKSLTRGNSQQVADESIRDTLLDLANYAIMTVIEMDREADAKAGA